MVTTVKLAAKNTQDKLKRWNKKFFSYSVGSFRCLIGIVFTPIWLKTDVFFYVLNVCIKIITKIISNPPLSPSWWRGFHSGFPGVANFKIKSSILLRGNVDFFLYYRV